MPESSVKGTPISRIPYGLLGILGLKTQGAYPLYLRDDFQPTFEMLDLLHASHAQPIRELAISLATAGNNIIPTMQVPQDQLWYVPAGRFTGEMPTPAATTSMGLIVIGGDGTGTANALQFRLVSPLTLFDFAIYAATSRPAISNPIPFFVGPGQTLGFRMGIAAAQNGNFTVQALQMQV